MNLVSNPLPALTSSRTLGKLFNFSRSPFTPWKTNGSTLLPGLERDRRLGKSSIVIGTKREKKHRNVAV